jgi:hypothetical protein
MTSFVSKSGHYKETCYDEIGVCGPTIRPTFPCVKDQSVVKSLMVIC